MGFLESVDVYFRGEKTVGLAIIPVGLLLLGAGLYLVRWYGGGLGKGMGLPLIVVGVLAAGAGGILVKTVSTRQAGLEAAFARDPQAPVQAEVARMARVNASWPVLKVAWAALSVLGLGLVLFVKRDWVVGVALALICLCAIAMVVDVFAEARARIYTARITS